MAPEGLLATALKASETLAGDGDEAEVTPVATKKCAWNARGTRKGRGRTNCDELHSSLEHRTMETVDQVVVRGDLQRRAFSVGRCTAPDDGAAVVELNTKDRRDCSAPVTLVPYGGEGPLEGRHHFQRKACPHCRMRDK